MIFSSSSIKSKAINLRLKGKSYRQVSTKLKIPLSTVYLWTKNIELSKIQKQEIVEKHIIAFKKGRIVAQKINHERATIVKKRYLHEGKGLIETISKRELTLIGAALYWSEGFKKDNRLGFANSDPDMINLVLKWLYEIGGVKKEEIRLRVGINIHCLSRTGEIQQKWSTSTHIPLSQFQKPFYQKTKQEKIYPHPENYLGVLRIRANKQGPLFYKILGMINGLKSLSSPFSI